MKTFLSLLGATAAFCTLLSFAPTSSAQTFQLHSADVAASQPIEPTFAFNGFGCTGQNTSPAPSWSHPPPDTRSFAVMVHDPDAETGGAGSWHWVVINLPPGATGLARGAGTPGWGGLADVGHRRRGPHRLADRPGAG